MHEEVFQIPLFIFVIILDFVVIQIIQLIQLIQIGGMRCSL